MGNIYERSIEPSLTLNSLRLSLHANEGAVAKRHHVGHCLSCTAMGSPTRAADRTSLSLSSDSHPNGHFEKRGKPHASPVHSQGWMGNLSASKGHGAGGRGSSKKRMAVCNGRHRGLSMTLL